MSEKWGISRVGKLELEVGETLQEAIIRLQILPLPPLAWTDCFLQTVRGHEVTIIGTETHPDKIEAVARPAEVEDVLGKIDSAIENANEYVEKVVLPSGVKPTVTLRVLKPTRGRNYRPSLTSSRKSYPNPNTPKTRVPTESHLVRYFDLKKCSRLSRLLIARIRPEFRDADARGVPAPASTAPRAPESGPDTTSSPKPAQNQYPRSLTRTTGHPGEQPPTAPIRRGHARRGFFRSK